MAPPRRSARAAAAAAVAAPDASQAPSPAPPPASASQSAPAGSTPLGTVDPQSGFGESATVYQQPAAPFFQYDAMLNLLDLSKNMDKYYLLQVVQQKKGRSTEFYCHSRWGRTGTSGQSQCFKSNNVAEAVEKFHEKFRDKTGQEWLDKENFVHQPGKYKLLKAAAVAEGPAATWQYFVDDNVGGKANGWYDYDEEASQKVEELNLTFLSNPEMSKRVVESGDYSYLVDLTKGTQTNTETNRTRAIRRNVSAPVVSAAAAPAPAPAPAAATAAAGAAGPAGAKKGKQGRRAAQEPEEEEVEEEEKDSSAPTKAPSKRKKTQAAAAQAATAPATSTATTAPTSSKSSGSAANKTKVAAAVQVSAQQLVDTMGSGKVDPTCPKAASAFLLQGYDVMLNQTDIVHNKNKFYLMQLMYEAADCFVWTRWGRVGEIGMTQLQGPMDAHDARKEFAKKFKAKTGNTWDDKDNFVVKAGKYEIVEVAAAEDVAADTGTSSQSLSARLADGTSRGPCQLDSPTQVFVDLIFNEDMFKDAMTALELDVERIPLGRLSKAQVLKGMGILEEIEAAIDSGASTVQLSSRFYQAIPHACGRKQPPAITDLADVRSKFELLNVLGDIELAQGLVRGGASDSHLHPSDAKYKQLQADLVLLKKNVHEYKVLETYLKNTCLGGTSIEHVWRVNRHGEEARVRPFNSLTNRKLLWHGTNIAVVAAILKSGLRIMPHSGGRVGRGIYLASECAKSQGYVQGTRVRGRYLGVMFLVEAALGEEHHIVRDDPSLVQPPAGFDSVVAMGSQEPDPTQDTELKFDGLKVKVPQGRPMARSAYSNSSFSNSEYLVYQEAQHRIRYVLTVWL